MSNQTKVLTSLILISIMVTSCNSSLIYDQRMKNIDLSNIRKKCDANIPMSDIKIDILSTLDEDYEINSLEDVYKTYNDKFNRMKYKCLINEKQCFKNLYETYINNLKYKIENITDKANHKLNNKAKLERLIQLYLRKYIFSEFYYKHYKEMDVNAKNIFITNNITSKKNLYGLQITMTSENDSILVTYDYSKFKENIFGGYQKDYREIGIDKLLINVLNGRLIISYGTIENNLYGIDIQNFSKYLLRHLGTDNFIVKISNNEFGRNEINNINDEYKRELKKYYGKVFDEISIINDINDEKLFCYLYEKKIKFFDDKNNVKLNNINTAMYKNTDFVVFDILYLNTFNNINIKFNDQYKISRYLFDHLIRKGIRYFKDCLSYGYDGLSFQILATDQNFVSKDKTNFSVYEFYLPKHNIISYISDDITGQDLAENSYILVNNERIELR